MSARSIGNEKLKYHKLYRLWGKYGLICYPTNERQNRAYHSAGGGRRGKFFLNRVKSWSSKVAKLLVFQ